METNESEIRADFLTYSGQDFGIVQEDINEARRISDTLETTSWDTVREQKGWQYNFSNREHVDPVQAIWRGLAYQEYCSEKALHLSLTNFGGAS
jgi:hypothetical protein